ncbi:MAG TPA: PAS domain-containing protein [Spirochaetia bacterium]|nr:PAS domain-containing protein [Spirochaetia bacterium]
MKQEELVALENLTPGARYYGTDSAKLNMRPVKLSEQDRAIMQALEPVVDAVAALFGPNCEVLIHSLEDLGRSVVKITNGQVTGREVGAPITDLGMKALRQAKELKTDVIGSYYSRTADGKTLKSVTALIRNGTKPIAMLCINLNLSAPLIDFASGLLPEAQQEMQDSPEHFVMSSEELVHKSVEKTVAEINRQRGLSALTRNRLVVKELYDQGIFDVKGAIDIVAQELGVSRYTIYNYIREAKA